MVTIPNTDFSSDIKLAQVLYCKTKEAMSKIADRLDLYVSPNIGKDKMARRLSEEMLSNPLEIVSRLSKTELLLLEEFLLADKDHYIVKKARKTEYLLQKWCLVLTYENMVNGKWSLLMPDEVRASLHEVAMPYIEMAKAGAKGPTAKELRLHSLMNELLGHSDFTISSNRVMNHHTAIDESKDKSAPPYGN